MNEDLFPIENVGSFQPVMLVFRGLTVNPKGYFADSFWRSFSDALTPELLATLEALKWKKLHFFVGKDGKIAWDENGFTVP